MSIFDALCPICIPFIIESCHLLLLFRSAVSPSTCRQETSRQASCTHSPHLSHWEIWWTWSGSNRRPLPCHFSSSIVEERHRESARDTEWQFSCGFLRCSRPCICARATLSKLTRDGEGCEGYDTNHDTNRSRVSARVTSGQEPLEPRTPSNAQPPSFQNWKAEDVRGTAFMAGMDGFSPPRF